MKKILNKNKKGTRMPKYRTEEQEQIVKFIVILLIVIAFVVVGIGLLFYLFRREHKNS